MADTGSPVKIGRRALSHGANPTAVEADDVTQGYANRHGIPWAIGGAPRVFTEESTISAAQTNLELIGIGAGNKIVVTRVSVYADNSNTVDVDVRVGFHLTDMAAPLLAGVNQVVLSHSGLPPGRGIVVGDGSGVLAIGADASDWRLECSVPTGGDIVVLTSYYTIES